MRTTYIVDSRHARSFLSHLYHNIPTATNKKAPANAGAFCLNPLLQVRRHEAASRYG